MLASETRYRRTVLVRGTKVEPAGEIMSVGRLSDFDIREKALTGKMLSVKRLGCNSECRETHLVRIFNVLDHRLDEQGDELE